MKPLVTAFVSGILFAIGLGISGMTLPSKVQGFLDLFGDWDPSLAFVMGGAVIAYAMGYRLITKRDKPLFAEAFSLPTRQDLTPHLVVGSAMFGVGWGLAGLCPGPAVVATATFTPEVLLFVAAMFVGFALHAMFERRVEAKRSSTDRSSVSVEASAE